MEEFFFYKLKETILVLTTVDTKNYLKIKIQPVQFVPL